MNDRSPDLAVLDVGKTSAKILVVDAAGHVAAQRRRDVPIMHGGAYPAIDVDTLGAWLIDRLAELAHTFDIKTIVPVAHGACAALIADDTRLLPVMDYEWGGVTTIDAKYHALRPTFAETRSPALSAGLNLGRQLYWLASHQPRTFYQAEAILCYPQYWTWFLCGARVSEVTSLGCHTDLWNPDARCFSSLVDRAGWHTLFPAFSPAWATAGRLRPALAARTNLRPDCQIKTGIHDSNASYLRHLAEVDPPFTVISTGTWIVLMAAGGDSTAIDEAADMLANVDVYGAPVPSARFMGGREFAEIARPEGDHIQPSEADATAVVAGGTLALPSFCEDSGPFADRHGGYVGQPPSDPHRRAALATLYCALICDYILDQLSADRGPLILEGRFTENPLFAPIVAQLRGQPVELAADAAGTAAGAARLANETDPRRQATTTCRVTPAGIDHLADYRANWRRHVMSAST